MASDKDGTKQNEGLTHSRYWHVVRELHADDALVESVDVRDDGSMRLGLLERLEVLLRKDHLPRREVHVSGRWLGVRGCVWGVGRVGHAAEEGGRWSRYGGLGRSRSKAWSKDVGPAQDLTDVMGHCK